VILVLNSTEESSGKEAKPTAFIPWKGAKLVLPRGPCSLPLLAYLI
jgi:hypothetical protein